MKLNFSLHLRYFITGCIIFVALIVLFYSVPLLYEDTMLEDILEEDENWGILLSIFLIFIPYSIGIISESFSNPLRESTLMSAHLNRFCSNSGGKDIIILHSRQFKSNRQMDSGNGFTDQEAYKYMLAYIISQNESLNKDIQGHFFKVHLATALQTACIILVLSSITQITLSDYNEFDSIIPYLISPSASIILLIALYIIKRKMRMDLLESIERAYFVLTEYPSVGKIRKI